jgi:hypothetical protein
VRPASAAPSSAGPHRSSVRTATFGCERTTASAAAGSRPCADTTTASSHSTPAAAEGEGDAGQRRQHLHRPWSDGPADRADDAEEAGIAGGEDDDVARLVRDGLQRGGGVVAQGDGADARRQLDVAQVTAAAHDERGAAPAARRRWWAAVRRPCRRR